MSDAIRLLESLGRAPAHVLESSGFTEMLDAMEVEGDEREALLARDPSRLAGLLQARATMVCLIAVPAQDEPVTDAPDPLGDPDAGDDGAGDADDARPDPAG